MLKNANHHLSLLEKMALIDLLDAGLSQTQFVKNAISEKHNTMRDARRARYACHHHLQHLEVRDQREQEARPGRRNREKSLAT